MITCTGCGSEIRWVRCSTCNNLSMSYILEQEAMEDKHKPEPLTDEQQAAHDTIFNGIQQREQERRDAEAEGIAERQEAEELRLFATGH